MGRKVGKRRGKHGAPGRRGPTRNTSRVEPAGVIEVNRRGYAFVSTAEGDFFIPHGRTGGAFNGDLVAVRPRGVAAQGQRRSAVVSHVLQRNTSEVVGIYERNGGLGVVRPSDVRIDHDIFCDASGFPSARSGDIVVVHVDVYPSRNISATGTVVEVVGHEGDPDLRVRTLIRRYGLETTFSEASLEQAEAQTLNVEDALLQEGRRDLRDLLVFTVDPVDARDFDDAISLEREPNGAYHLWVHIADVAEYVPWDSSLDLDARRRATSVYLADRVLPMLPENLSNNLCSLKPDEDRLAMTVELLVGRDGTVVEAGFYPSVIRSRFRLDYDSVLDFLEGREQLPDPDLAQALTLLDGLAQTRFRARAARGGIDFDGSEVKLVLDAQDKVVDILQRHRTRATGAVEEAMILANEAVATYLSTVSATMVYRVHAQPSKDAMAALLPLLVELGYPTEGLMRLDPHAIQAVLATAEQRPEKDLVTMRVLRSMKRAVYSPLNTGHYGLASECYCHFTSPIRRYPDLMVHRLLHGAVAGAFDAKGEVRKKPELKPLANMASQLEWLCRHSSEMERVAQDATFDSIRMKLCEYLVDRVGTLYDGMVTSVSAAGLFVTLPNTIKGLVPIRTLGDEYFDFDPEHQSLTGQESNGLYRIGQHVRVRLTAVSVDEMTVDLELVKGA